MDAIDTLDAVDAVDAVDGFDTVDAVDTVVTMENIVTMDTIVTIVFYKLSFSNFQITTSSNYNIITLLISPADFADCRRFYLLVDDMDATVSFDTIVMHNLQFSNYNIGVSI